MMIKTTQVDTFKCTYEDHQCGISPLVEFGISCIDIFALDYMHMVCLGVTRRLLSFLKTGPKQCKLSMRIVDQISAALQSFKTQFCICVKATEYR